MLTQETKRKIDSARDILVGKVPDPKAQVEQITTALIYKFMDDMDKGSQELGGKARFFTGDFEKYSWTKLMDSKLGGHDRMDLYVETLTKLSLNPNIPQLFRDIFKDAFLPYRSPETLSLFLKEINGFTYEHSEDLGDSFEYLLSVLGSQGDAGQFRTPRHIIDFIVAAVDPKKDDVICDPACGTAGFLISAYKHILKQHDGKDDPENKEKPLTPDERKNLMDHFTGYDISPDMVRLSRVNLYLHGFPSPTIYEYDTLSSEEKWDESFDVMLANPPFMTPKGGIRPHKRFSVQANRSEVLFVDYILEHLRPNGRAGIIVPEGIIFQSANAYKTLRKLLVEDGLLTVVSLPSGVFNPYSGVKTGILLFDKMLAKKTNEILFVKIENDGFDLGAQRRKIDKNDLPEALEVVEKWKSSFVIPAKVGIQCLAVKKEKIAESGDYNLSGDRYKEVAERTNQKWPMVKLGEVANLIGGFAFKSEKLSKQKKENYLPIIKIGNLQKYGKLDLDKTEYHELNDELNKYLIEKGDILIAMTGATVGKVSISQSNNLLLNQRVGLVRAESNKIERNFLQDLLLNDKFYNYCQVTAGGGAQGNIAPSQILKYEIPLPPIEVQKEIVEQIEVKQQAIAHAKAIIKNLERERAYFGQALRKLEAVEWVELGEVCEELFAGGDVPKDYSKTKSDEYIIPIYSNGIGDKSLYGFTKKARVDRECVTISARGTIGFPEIRKEPFYPVIRLIVAIPKQNIIDTSFMKHILETIRIDRTGNSIPQLTVPMIKKVKIPLPPLETQKQLVAEAEREEEIAAANRRLIEIMEQKIADILSEI